MFSICQADEANDPWRKKNSRMHATREKDKATTANFDPRLVRLVAKNHHSIKGEPTRLQEEQDVMLGERSPPSGGETEIGMEVVNVQTDLNRSIYG